VAVPVIRRVRAANAINVVVKILFMRGLLSLAMLWVSVAARS
jgi:hypothetical protein